ncbi:hypothetical protein HK098_005412 [Nowakowskiella sp. JEL0407]|nr:hypothetical protein HK098_005412 [Nowakowskiella sp. JEL0407]
MKDAKISMVFIALFSQLLLTLYLLEVGYSNFNLKVFPKLLPDGESIPITELKDEIRKHLKSQPDDLRIAKRIFENDQLIEWLDNDADDTDTIVKQLESLIECTANNRQFNLELFAAPLFSNGNIVNLLIESGAGKYLEFKALEDMYIWTTEGLEHVPGSKEDVFGNKSLSLIEKRILMKVLTLASTYEEHIDSWSEYRDLPYAKFLESQRVSESLQHVIIHSISMPDTDQEILTEEGLKLTKEHLSSIGRFGKTMFLCCLYGALSELSQGFCRMSAVHGGTFILDLPIEKLSKKDNFFVLETPEENFSANYLICSPNYVSKTDFDPSLSVTERTISHAIVIVDKKASLHGGLELIVFPPENISNKHTIYCYQQSSETNSTPSGKNVLYFQTKTNVGAEEDLTPAIKSIINIELTATDPNKPNALLIIYYSQTIKNCAGSRVDNFFIAPNPDNPMKLDDLVPVARKIFHQITKSETFFPPPEIEDE